MSLKTTFCCFLCSWRSVESPVLHSPACCVSVYHQLHTRSVWLSPEQRGAGEMLDFALGCSTTHDLRLSLLIAAFFLDC